MRRATRSLSAALLVAASAAACSREPRPTPAPVGAATRSPATVGAPSAPALPVRAPLAPSEMHVAPGEPVDGALVTETESCAGCHASAAAQWRSSAHAFASFNNPIYRVAVDRFRDVAHVHGDDGKDLGDGRAASRFCGGCHDVALLVDGAMAGEVGPKDPRAHGGVTCRVCHGMDETHADGNGSYVLASTPVPIPREGDAESVRAHKARMAEPTLRTAALCGTCHRAFLTPETGNASVLVGQEELGAWSESAYAGSLSARVDEDVEERDCAACHMPREDATLGDAAAKQGRVASHRFAGAHTWLAAMRGDAEQRARTEAMLRGAASVDVPVIVRKPKAGSATRAFAIDRVDVEEGDTITLDVVVRNERVGHRFPAGTGDAQDTWLEVDVTDARGARVADAGAEQATRGDDPTAHLFKSVQADENGQPVLARQTDLFRATVYNHTIPPRDAVVVRYAFVVPPGAALPLTVRARVRHRSRNLVIARAVCADAKTARGAAFAAEVRRRTDAPLDPCAPEPITDVAETAIALGGAPLPDARPAWARLWAHALGVLHALQEQADEARPSLDRALAELPADAGDRPRAMLLALYGQVAARQTRTEEAMEWLDRAARVAPRHPAIARARGEALAAVWRWGEAATALADAADRSPRDDKLWSELAVAWGSAGRPLEALDAAARGLALQPRDGDMLRVQALALESLGAPSDVVQRARDGYVAFHPPDDAPRIRAACSAKVVGCALERVPVHVHVMRPARR